MIIRPSFTVIGGAAIGLMAGAAVYGAVSSTATPTVRPAKAVVAAAPAAEATCAEGQKLENGVCVIHVQRTVLVPASATGLFPGTSGASEAAPAASHRTESPASDHSSATSGDATEAEAEAEATETEVGETAKDAAEGAKDAMDSSEPQHTAGLEPSDDSATAPH